MATSARAASLVAAFAFSSIVAGCAGTTMTVLPSRPGSSEGWVQNAVYAYLGKHEPRWQGCGGMPTVDGAPPETVLVRLRAPTELEYGYRYVYGDNCRVRVEAHGVAHVRPDGSIWIGRPVRRTWRGKPVPQ